MIAQFYEEERTAAPPSQSNHSLEPCTQLFQRPLNVLLLAAGAPYN
jgi:hypothetical protein